MQMDVEHVVKVQNLLGECPVWDHHRGCLYWVDIEQSLFYRYHPQTGDLMENELEIPIFALGLRAAGGLVAGTDEGFITYEPDENRFDRIGDAFVAEPDRRFNDGAVDSMGRFWAGTLDKDRTATNHLYRLDPDMQYYTMESGIIQSNGIDWSPDWKTMYLTDTRRHTIYAYDFDLAGGLIGNRRELIRTPEDANEGVPDGLVVDAEGFIWSARFRGWKIVRYDPDGKLEREVRLPVQRPSSLVFGGQDLDEIYITSGLIEIPPEERCDHPMAGGILRLRPGVRGKPMEEFGG